MRGAWIVYRRELAGLFLRPMAWVLLFLALAFHGIYFALFYLPWTGGDVSTSLELTLGGGIPYWRLMMLLPPLITMRMISDESRSGLLEFLLTAPVRDSAVVLGKLGAATTFMSLLWGASIFYALGLDWLGTVPAGGVDWGPVWTGLLGSVLASAFFCSIGLVVSAATSTPIVAGFLSMVINFLVVQVFPLFGRIGNLDPDSWVHEVLAHLNVVSQLQGSFLTGVLDTRALVFFVVWIAFFVFLATRFLEMQRWRG